MTKVPAFCNACIIYFPSVSVFILSFILLTYIARQLFFDTYHIYLLFTCLFVCLFCFFASRTLSVSSSVLDPDSNIWQYYQLLPERQRDLIPPADNLSRSSPKGQSIRRSQTLSTPFENGINYHPEFALLLLFPKAALLQT